MKFEETAGDACKNGQSPLKTLDAASATRVVAIDLQVFNVSRQVQSDGGVTKEAMSNSGDELVLQSRHVTGRLVEVQPLTQREMLESFRSLREARRDRHEDDMVIDAIVDDERPNSLSAAIKRE